MPAESPGRALAVTLAGALAVVIAVLVLALSDRDVHLAGTNNVFNRFPVAELAPGDQLCEQYETVPADAAAVRFSVAPGADVQGGPLAVRVLHEGRAVSRGERAGGWEGESVDVPIAAVPRTLTEAQVCVTNRGEAALTLRGYGIEPARLGFRLRGEQVDQQIRLSYLRAEPESWWSMASVVAHRFGIGRGELFGGWLPFAWLLGVVAMGAVVVRLMLREARK
jgi:hypothetical protein